ncbi:mitochondrial carrier [Phaffia rhodozyma]|uniref:Mitochondrial carrier n=1 Tax=Phaffia rhodozyma TaxID=264483 RepID=A0A0F7SKS5_PHARH|nr:mitochondrial carrier [Phaffia rhodozyma]
MSDIIPNLEEVKATQSNPDLLLNLLAGSAGGACQVIVGQPLDTIKTRAQTAAKGQFKGPWDIAVKTVRNEGVLALYKASTKLYEILSASPLMGVAAVNSLLFTAYSTAKKLISPYPDLTIPQIALAGGIAGGVNSVLASPVELFKIRMQCQYGTSTDKSLSGVAKDLWRDYGFRRGVMRGFKVSFIRELPAYAGFYSAYEFSKRTFKQRLYPQQDLPVWSLLLSGATGGVAYWLASYPLDLVKSKVQLANTPPEKGYITRELRQIVRESGFSGLFRGLSPTLVRAVPAAASTFVAFEISREFLIKHAGF